MATLLAVQRQLDLVESETAPTMTAADPDGHTHVNHRGEQDLEPELYVENASGADLTLTIVSVRASNFGVFPNKTVTILAGTLTIVPAFDMRRFSDPGTWLATFTLSATTDVRVAAVEPGRYYKEQIPLRLRLLLAVLAVWPTLAVAQPMPIGDSVFVNGADVVNPDLRSDGDIDVIKCTEIGVPDADCAAPNDVIFRGGGATGGDSAAAFAACRAGVKGWGFDAATDTYGATCGNYAWSAESGGVAGTIATAASYLTATTNGGNAFTLTCTGVGVGTSGGTTYNVATELQSGAPTDGTATVSGSGATTLGDTAAGMTVNDYADHTIRITAGTCNGQDRQVLSNTATAFTVGDAWTACTPDATTTYVVYDPIGSVCHASGEVARVNFMADAALAQDHTRADGTVYFPELGSSATLYTHRGCGRKGNASTTNTPNACPVLRAPHDEHYHRVPEQIGNIAWRFEGGPDFDADDHGRRGSWVIDDAGSVAGGAHTWRDPGGPTPGAWSFQRTGLRIGTSYNGGSLLRICDPNASGYCKPGSSTNDGVSSTAWGRQWDLQNTSDITDELAFCVGNSDTVSIAGDGGVCSLDRRIQCTSNANCDFTAGADPDRGDLGPCENAAEAFEYEAETAKRPVFVFVGYRSNSFPESGSSADIPSEGSWGRVVDAPRSACGNGESVSFTQHEFPARAAKIPVGGAILIVTDWNEIEGGATGGWYGYTWSPNQYVERDADKDGVKDFGDCLTTASSPDCDDSEGPTLYGGFRHRVQNAVHAYCSATPGEGGFSCFDGDTFSFDQQARDLTFYQPKRGYLTDLSDVRLYDVLIQECDALSGGMNAGFVSNSEVARVRFQQCNAPSLISFSSAKNLKISDLEFISTFGNAISLRRGEFVEISGVRFSSHRGMGFEISPAFELGSISISHVTGAGRMALTQPAVSWPEAFIFFGRAFTTSGFESAIRQLVIDDVHVGTVFPDGCLVFLDDDKTPAQGPIDIERKKISITNSSIDGLNGTSGQRIVCVDTVGTGEAGDCGSGCDAADSVALSEGYLPMMRNNKENGAPALEQPYPVVDGTPATSAGDCDDIARLGSVVRLVTDTAAGACTDVGADGVLDGGGTAVSVCQCLASTAWGAL